MTDNTVIRQAAVRIEQVKKELAEAKARTAWFETLFEMDDDEVIRWASNDPITMGLYLVRPSYIDELKGQVREAKARIEALELNEVVACRQAFDAGFSARNAKVIEASNKMIERCAKIVLESILDGWGDLDPFDARDLTKHLAAAIRALEVP